MSTGGMLSKQSNENQSGGGNSSTYSKNRLHQPPNFQGRSGQPDNQDTNRGKGGR